MNVEITFNEAELSHALELRFQEVKQPCQEAMATAFEELVHENIGQEEGSSRPVWKKELSKGYARKVKRPFATLSLTGALKDSIESGATNEFGWVEVNTSVCDYAAEHQWGNPDKNLPQRSFFPIAGVQGNAEFTPEAVDKCLEACKDRIREILQ